MRKPAQKRASTAGMRSHDSFNRTGDILRQAYGVCFQHDGRAVAGMREKLVTKLKGVLEHPEACQFLERTDPDLLESLTAMHQELIPLMDNPLKRQVISPELKEQFARVMNPVRIKTQQEAAMIAQVYEKKTKGMSRSKLEQKIDALEETVAALRLENTALKSENEQLRQERA